MVRLGTRTLAALLALMAAGCSGTTGHHGEDGTVNGASPMVRASVRGQMAPARGHHLAGPDAFTVDFHNRTWVDLDDGHILVGRADQLIWRSSGIYPVASAKDDIYVALVGAPGVAFQIQERGALYVAAGRGPERPVAMGEWPEAWTPSGNLITVRTGTDQGRDWAIVLRGADGTFIRTLADGLSIKAIDSRSTDSDGWFWFWTAGGNLVRTDGAAIVTVSNYLALGFGQSPSPLWQADSSISSRTTGTW